MCLIDNIVIEYTNDNNNNNTKYNTRKPREGARSLVDAEGIHYIVLYVYTYTNTGKVLHTSQIHTST